MAAEAIGNQLEIKEKNKKDGDNEEGQEIVADFLSESNILSVEGEI